MVIQGQRPPTVSSSGSSHRVRGASLVHAFERQTRICHPRRPLAPERLQDPGRRPRRSRRSSARHGHAMHNTATARSGCSHVSFQLASAARGAASATLVRPRRQDAPPGRGPGSQASQSPRPALPETFIGGTVAAPLAELHLSHAPPWRRGALHTAMLFATSHGRRAAWAERPSRGSALAFSWPRCARCGLSSMNKEKSSSSYSYP